MDDADRDYQALLQRGELEADSARSLPPLLRGRPDLLEDSPRTRRRIRSEKRRVEDQGNISQFFPRMAYPRPFVPEPPYKIQDPPREEDAMGRPACNLDSLKRQLIFPTSARSMLAPPSARNA